MSRETKSKLSQKADDPVSCTSGNLRRATRAVSQIYDGALAPVGLKGTQFTLLAALSKLGEVPLTRLAEALVLDRTTLSRNLQPLMDQGFIRSVSDQDRRVRRLALTARGRRKLDQALPHWRDAQRRMVEGLGPERWSRLLTDLSMAIEVAQEA